MARREKPTEADFHPLRFSSTLVHRLQNEGDPLSRLGLEYTLTRSLSTDAKRGSLSPTSRWINWSFILHKLLLPISNPLHLMRQVRKDSQGVFRVILLKLLKVPGFKETKEIPISICAYIYMYTHVHTYVYILKFYCIWSRWTASLNIYNKYHFIKVFQMRALQSAVSVGKCTQVSYWTDEWTAGRSYWAWWRALFDTGIQYGLS